MDELAREYLLISLSLGELEDGFVDAYYGPPELLDEARASKAAPLELALRARSLRARLGDETDDLQRATWLDRQLIALETLARRLGGEPLPYLEEVGLCFDARPEPTPPEEYAAVRSALEELVSGQGDLRVRLAQRDERLALPVGALPAIVEWLTGQLRAAASSAFEVPQGESLTVTLVSDKPWSAYNWYSGALQSLIEINTDQPVGAQRLVPLLAHEAFPGHHLEHASKEANLVGQLGRAEATIQLINTPEAYISEGLAEAGVRFVAPAARWQQLLVEICARAGITMTADEAEREWRISRVLRRLRGSSGDAALQLHVGGRSREDVVAFLEQEALRTRGEAEKSLEFLTHPLWRTYVFCYAGGERLLSAWISAASDESAQRARYARLLKEQLTPSGIAAEVAQTG